MLLLNYWHLSGVFLNFGFTLFIKKPISIYNTRIGNIEVITGETHQNNFALLKIPNLFHVTKDNFTDLGFGELTKVTAQISVKTSHAVHTCYLDFAHVVKQTRNYSHHIFIVTNFSVAVQNVAMFQNDEQRVKCHK